MKSVVALLLLAFAITLSHSVRIEFFKEPEYRGESYVKRFAFPYVCYNLPEDYRQEVSSVKLESLLDLSIYLSSELDCRGVTFPIDTSIPHLGEVGYDKTAQSYRVRIFRSDQDYGM